MVLLEINYLYPLFSILDIEATGGRPRFDHIMEIAVINFDGQKEIDRYHTLINPGVEIPPFIQNLTGIKNSMLDHEPKFESIANNLKSFIGDNIVVAHNIQFDYNLLRQSFRQCNIEFHNKKLCTVQLSRKYIPEAKLFNLADLCKYLGIPLLKKHRALDDTQATYYLFEHLVKKASLEQINILAQNGFLPSDMLIKIPEEKLKTIPPSFGVYYYLDDKNQILYADNSSDLQNKIIQQLSFTPISQQRKEMLQRIQDIEFEVCGNELYSRIRENQLLEQYRPRFNKRIIKQSKYAIYSSINKLGILTTSIKPIQDHSHSLASFASRQEAKSHLYRQLIKHKLCAKYLGLEASASACSKHKMGVCNGVCMNKESIESYNTRARSFINSHNYPYADFIITENGITADNKFVLIVKSDSIITYGFIDNNINDLDKMLNQLPLMNLDASSQNNIKRIILELDYLILQPLPITESTSS